MEEKREQQFRCTGDCIQCHRGQREYCAAQKAYDNQRILLAMQEALNAMSGTVEELKAKVIAIQDSEAMVYDPNAEEEKSGIPNLPIGTSEKPTDHAIAQKG